MAEKKTAAKGYQKFKADLAAGTLGEVYIFCGEESYLREYYLKEAEEACPRGALRSSISTASQARA